MEFDKQLKLGHLLLVDRKCRTCGELKNLIDGEILSQFVNTPLIQRE